MKKIASMLLIVAVLLTAGTALALEQKDNAACKDHQLFTRMPTYWIHSCTQKQFDARAFVTGKDAAGKEQTEQQEGRLWEIRALPWCIGPLPNWRRGCPSAA